MDFFSSNSTTTNKTNYTNKKIGSFLVKVEFYLHTHTHTHAVRTVTGKTEGVTVVALGYTCKIKQKKVK